MTDLTTKLKTATEGSRGLSDEVMEALGRYTTEFDPGDGDIMVTWHNPDGTARGRLTSDPTRSLDDALSLVPEGWKYQLIHTGAVQYLHGAPFHASIKPPSEYAWTVPPGPYDGVGKTMALALCAAILKAET